MGILAASVREDPRLSRPATDDDFVEAVGERVALLGRAGAGLELWCWPLQVLVDLRFALRRPDGSALPDVERRVTVTPAGFSVELWAGEAHVHLDLGATQGARALLALARLEAPPGAAPLELVWRFRPTFRPMWPAGLGGQLAFTDAETGAFALTEELGRFAALIGAPGARVSHDALDHALPDGPVELAQPLSPGEPTPLVFAGAERVPEPLGEAARLGLDQSATGLARARPVLDAARALWRETATDAQLLLRRERERWSAFLARTTALESSDPVLDDAFLWAKLAVERAWVTVDGLGRGLVAGLAPAGASLRPGYGWFFDGDALAGARAMAGYGDHDGAREVLRFAASHQRADGKLMHELTLSAGLCDWFGSYPYAYYKGINGPDFVACLKHVADAAGDAVARELAATVERVLAWGRACCDGGRISNRRAGIAAVEAGPLSDRIEAELFLHGAWLDALTSAEELARRGGDEPAVRERAAWRVDAERALERFWSAAYGRHGFAALRDGERCDDRSVYVARAFAPPATRDLAHPEQVRATLSQLNEPALTADWGPRMFGTDSSIYDPAHYNTGAVFPYLANFAVLALYAHGLPAVAHQVLASQAALTHLGGIGCLQEHLVGDLLRVPARGVPHQVFSSAAIIESTVFGLFGLAPRADAGTLVARPALPPGEERVALRGVRVGGTRLDLAVERVRGSDGARLWITATRLDGPPLELRVEPVLAPCTLVRAARVDGRACEVQLAPHGASRTRACFPPVRLEAEHVLEVALRDGPELVLPEPRLERDAPSRALRLSAEEVDGGTVRFTLWAPAGSRQVVGLRGARPRTRVSVEPADGAAVADRGDELELRFPAAPTQPGGGADGFARLVLSLELAAEPGPEPGREVSQ